MAPVLPRPPTTTVTTVAGPVLGGVRTCSHRVRSWLVGSPRLVESPLDPGLTGRVVLVVYTEKASGTPQNNFVLDCSPTSCLGRKRRLF